MSDMPDLVPLAYLQQERTRRRESHRRELIARSNLDDLAVRVLETYLEALDWLPDDHPLNTKLDNLAVQARNARRLETLHPDRDELAQRATSLESTVRIAHREAVAIVDEIRTYGADTSYSRDPIEERALRIARMTDEILTGTPRKQGERCFTGCGRLVHDGPCDPQEPDRG